MNLLEPISVVLSVLFAFSLKLFLAIINVGGFMEFLFLRLRPTFLDLANCRLSYLFFVAQNMMKLNSLDLLVQFDFFENFLSFVTCQLN